jgi:leader peptidase (prepilin peptidase) / N-methyltransferase
MTAADSSLIVPLGVLSGVLGLVIGSFLNVVIWRLPRGESLSHPASACPKCGHAIRRRDNVPLISWLILRGKCRDCGEPISARYPLVELGTAVFFVAVTLLFLGGVIPVDSVSSTAAWTLPAFLYFAAISVALAAIDIDVKRLPDRIVLPSVVVGAVLLAVASAGLGDWWILLRAVIGAAALFLFYFILAFVYPKGMGFGDVKLALVVGLYLGWLGWGSLVVGAFAAFVLGGLFGLVMVIARRAGRRSGIPFGPWMLGGAWLGIIFGNQIWSGYLSLLGRTA